MDYLKYYLEKSAADNSWHNDHFHKVTTFLSNRIIFIQLFVIIHNIEASFIPDSFCRLQILNSSDYQ